MTIMTGTRKELGSFATRVNSSVPERDVPRRAAGAGHVVGGEMSWDNHQRYWYWLEDNE